MSTIQRIVVGISGASGALLAKYVLQCLSSFDQVETHLVMSNSAKRTLELESGLQTDELQNLANCVYDNDDVGAAIASGSFKTAGMIIVPCSMKSVACIANGISESLLLRAADVMIKEQRPLVIVPREAPLSPIHLNNLLTLSRLSGVKIIPPVINNYQHVKTIEELQIQIAYKLLDCFGLECPQYRRWGTAY